MKASNVGWLFRPREFEPRDIAVARDLQHFEALVAAHVWNVDGRHRIVGDDAEHDACPKHGKMAARNQRRQRTFQSPQIKRLFIVLTVQT